LYVVIGAADHTGASAGDTADLLEVRGVAGIWVVGPKAPELAEPTKPAEPTATTPPAGTGESLAEEIMVVYLDEDPVETAERIEDVLAPRWEKTGLRPRLAGPFETISPWSWDWFEADRREEGGQ
jgi:hypothetical protein